MATKQVSKEITVDQIDVGTVEFGILGTSPTITSRMSMKAKEELLMPKGRKTAAEKRGNVKHEVLQEYRDSSYTSNDDKSPTYLTCLSAAFKKMLEGAATDMPGVAKTQVQRNLVVLGERNPLYGLPQMMMAVTRCADMNRTPDIRTRLIVPEWATIITVQYVKPYFTARGVANLLYAAGITQGLGEWRPQKGAGSFGQFQVVDVKDKELQKRIKATTYKKQYDAVHTLNPECYDDETETLFDRYISEMNTRGIHVLGTDIMEVAA